MELERFSYQCGVLDAFAEMVRAGVKQLALSHPCANVEERNALLVYAQQLCEKYGILCCPEDELLITDLFPAQNNVGKPLILLFGSEKVLQDYRELKRRKQELLAMDAYKGKERREIARGFGRLLSYKASAIERFIDENKGKE